MGHFVLDPVTANANAEWGPVIPTTLQATPHNIKQLTQQLTLIRETTSLSLNNQGKL